MSEIDRMNPEEAVSLYDDFSNTEESCLDFDVQSDVLAEMIYNVLDALQYVPPERLAIQDYVENCCYFKDIDLFEHFSCYVIKSNGRKKEQVWYIKISDLYALRIEKKRDMRFLTEEDFMEFTDDAVVSPATS